MKEQLIHILDQSVCLSRKQMKEYISGTMQHEEMHAAEVHLSACPLCSMAMEGFDAHSEASLEAIASLNSGFLKEHFDNIAPQIHLNSMAPAAALPAGRRSAAIQPFWRTASIAAGILALFGGLWYVEFGRNNLQHAPAVATHQPMPSPVPQNDAPGPDPAAAEGVMSATAPEVESKVSAPPPDASSTRAKTVDAVATVKESAPPAAPQFKPAPVKATPAKAPTPAPESVASISGASARSIEIKAARAYTPPVLEPVGKTVAPDVSAAPATAQEKLVVRELSDVATYNAAPAASRNTTGINLSGARSSGTKYVVDGVQAAKKQERSHIELGNDAFERGKYSAALIHYKKQMTSGTPAERSQAKLRAARCYAALGKKAKAEELLDTVMQEGSGAERREARRVLRGLK